MTVIKHAGQLKGYGSKPNAQASGGKIKFSYTMINLNNKAEQQAAANSIQKKARRIVTMKSGNNQAMVQPYRKPLHTESTHWS